MTGVAGQGSLPLSRRWLPIGGIVVLMIVHAAVVALMPPNPATRLALLPAAVGGFTLTICSPVCVYLDRRYVMAVSDRQPSGWYYRIVLAPLYPVRHHQFVGVP